MTEERGKTHGHDQPNAPRRMVLAGRLKKREQGVVQIDLADGLTVDVSEDDCELVQETTDAVTMRSIVAITLKGDKPITATFQPHLYRVLAQARATPFSFGRVAEMPAAQFDWPAIIATAPGGGGGPHHTTAMMSTTWMGTTQQDGTKGDSAGEPDEIFLP